MGWEAAGSRGSAGGEPGRPVAPPGALRGLPAPHRRGRAGGGLRGVAEVMWGWCRGWQGHLEKGRLGVCLCAQSVLGGAGGAGADPWWCPGTGQEAAELPNDPRWAGERIAIRGIADASSG